MASEFEASLDSRMSRLPPDRQREVVDFVAALERRSAAEAVGGREKMSIEEIDALFKKTQARAQAQAITDEDIAAEIAAYRAGR
jgi:hypothetical protein